MSEAHYGYADLVMGTFWGDEGKGLETARRIQTGNYGMAIRFNGGSNAGHERGDITLNQIPSSIGLVEYSLLANGSLVDPELLLPEMDNVRSVLGIEVTPASFGISDTAHLVLPHHKLLDGIREAGDKAHGSTKKGISFVSADKYGREGVRGELLTWAPHKIKDIVIRGLDLANQALKEHGHKPVQTDYEFYRWIDAARQLIPFMVESIELIDERMSSGVNVLLESAQALGLDIEFGAFPFNSSSHVGPGGALNGTGIRISRIRDRVVVTKIPITRVGGEKGPFVTRLGKEDEDIAEVLQGKPEDIDGEYGKVSGRKREIGWPDPIATSTAVKLVDATEIVLTKLDKVPGYGDKLQVSTSYTLNGEKRLRAPNSGEKLMACEPNFELFPNWTQDIAGIRDYDELPEAARNLVEVFERIGGAPVTAIGIGPQIDQVVYKNKPTSAVHSNGSTHARV